MPEEEKKETGIESPFVDQPKPESYPGENFDYNAYQYEHTGKAIMEVWRLLGENANRAVWKIGSTREEIQADIDFFSEKVMNILIACDVPHRDIQNMTDNFFGFLELIFKHPTRTYKEYVDELLAYTIKEENPGAPLYDRDYATVGGLYRALHKARELEPDKYFNIQNKKKEVE